ncbi:hypothetical protein FACS189446_0490 [Bacteroidia bacterium]|nr:hypothetical protein FACS189446_0490 [Bacteroidia bacterium]
MKKIYTILVLLAGLTTFWACEDDQDSNPVYRQPESFVLNTPGYASIVTDLQKSTALVLTCSQPDYGFTAATTYAVQVSLNDTWIDGTEEVPATYQELPISSTTAKPVADAKDLDRAIAKLSNWEDAEALDGQPIDLFIRLKASVSSFTSPVYSNVVKIKVLPYYIKLTDALPATYYLIGDCIGDGTWTNSQDAIGVSIIPLSLIENQEYNITNGTGEFAYTGHFPAGKGFKLIGVPGSWDEQWGVTDGAFSHNDGGSGNITVATDGWYTVTLNTAKNELKVEAATVTSAEFATMQLVGTFEGWGTTPVDMTQTAGEHSHVWYTDVTFDADADVSGSDPEGCKFRTDDSWSNNWGGNNFPYSITSGSNIPYKAGKYRVVFDDLNNCYFFFISE